MSLFRIDHPLLKTVGNIATAYMKLRAVVLGSLNGLDTLKSASSAFDSKAVTEALDRLINLIVDATIRFSDAYSGSRCKRFLQF